MSTIMDVLAKAAVSEICKLVDDGYAVLRLEISRSKEENQTLKRKLKVMELMIAQGCVAPEESDSDKAACKGELTSGKFVLLLLFHSILLLHVVQQPKKMFIWSSRLCKTVLLCLCVCVLA